MNREVKIIIIDDDPGFRKTLSDILKAKGYVPEGVAKGKTALSTIEEDKPAVALIDLMLVDMPGLQVMSEIKKRSPDTECIVLTGFASQDSAIEAINLGAYSYIQKPYDVEQLLLTVRRAVEKRDAAEVLRESEEKFRNLSEQSPNMIFINQGGRVVYANQRCEEIMGYSKEEFYAPDFDFLTLISPEYASFVKETFATHMSGEDVAPYEYALQTKEGKRIETIINPKLILYEGKAALLGIVTDITELKKTEEALRREHDLVTRITETSPAGVSVVNRDGQITFANSRAEEVLGLTKDKITQRVYNDPKWKITDYDGGPFPDEQLPFQIIIKTGKPVFDVRHAIEWPDGERILLSINAAPLFDASGHVNGMVATVENITERMQAEYALQASELRYRRLFEHNLAAVYRTTLDGRIVDCNKAFIDLLGYESWEDIMKCHALDFYFHKQDRDTFIKRLSEKEQLTNFERKLKHKDGQAVWILENLHIIHESDETQIIQGTGIDITNRKQAEEALRASEERFRSLYENAMIGLYRTTPDGTILMANPALVRMLGFHSFEELIQRNLEKVGFAPAYSRSEFKNRIEADGEVVGLESAWIRNDGTTLFIRESARAVKDDEGKILYYEGTVEDITERHRAELALSESEERYRTLFDRVPVGLYRSTPDGQCLTANKAFLDIMGYPNLEALSKVNTVDSYVLSEDRERFEKLMEREDQINDFETQLRRGDEKIIWIKISARAVRNTDGQVLMYEGSVEDITAQKEADEKLKERERFLQNVFDGIYDGISVLDFDLNIIRVNQWIEKMYSSQFPLVGRKCYEVYQRRQSPCPFCPTIATIKDGVPRTEIVPYPSEENPTGWIELSAFPFEDGQGNIIGAIEHVKDITDRRRVEMTQKVSYDIANAVHTTEDLPDLYGVIRKSLGTIIDTTNFFIALYDSKTDTITLPYFIDEKDDFHTFPAGKTLTAWVIHRNEPLLATREDIDRMAQRGEVDTIGTKSKIWLGVPLKAKDEVIGALVVQSYEDEKAYDEKDRELLQFVSSQIGLSIERKRYEESLKVERNKLSNILDNMGDAVIIEDKNFNIIYQNKTSRELEGDLVGRKCYKALHNRSQPCDGDCPVRHFLRDNRTEPYVHTTQTRSGLFWDIIAVPFLDEKGNKVVLEVSRNITEQKRLREQLLQSEKMSALGQLISGVAHELNNPMTGVLGFSQLLLSSQELPGKTKQALEKIYLEAERARKIVQNLLTFARQHKPEKRNIQLNDVLNRTLDLRAYEMKVTNIDVIRNLDPHLPSLYADEHQLQQMFMNLIINAEQAMIEAHGKGRLEVTSRWNAPQKKITVSVHDDGPGIAHKHQSKIFDPFYTTKPIGKGTGLGLSISFGIVQEHGGHITAESKEGQGTTFRVELPVLSETSATHMVDQSETEASIPSTEKKILAVDDEAAVVDLVRAVLEQQGYEVTTAHDGDSALQKIEGEHFDVVITDLKMPGKDGIELYAYCKENQSELAKRFLFLTGDVVSSESLQFLTANDIPYVSKPFDLQHLISSVNHLLHPKQ